MKPAAASSGLSALPTLKERENEDIISTASEDDTPSPVSHHVLIMITSL